MVFSRPTTPPQIEESRRRIQLGAQEIEYSLRRSRRRSIGLSVDHRGLRVGAPLRARVGDIEALLHQHAAWVLDKLASWRERPPPAQFQVHNGQYLNILGEARCLEIGTARRAGGSLAPGQLTLRCPNAADAPRYLEKLLREEARRHFAERLAHFAPQLGVALPPLRLSSARTRWGSCNARGLIALNWRLIFLPSAIVDYVVCHELAHLKEMNHSPRFWAVVESLCPDWQALRRALREQGRQLPQL